MHAEGIVRFFDGRNEWIFFIFLISHWRDIIETEEKFFKWFLRLDLRCSYNLYNNFDYNCYMNLLKQLVKGFKGRKNKFSRKPKFDTLRMFFWW